MMLRMNAQQPSPLYPFNRALVQRRRTRAAQDFARYDFLVKEAAERLAERFDDMSRSFPVALELGAHTGELGRMLQGRGGITHYVQTDLSRAMLRQASGERIVADEEHLPFAPHGFDVIVSVLNLHWVNDVPSMLKQCWQCLKPDGLLMVSFWGGDTLTELRQAMIAAETATLGGVTPRISPFIDVREGTALLQKLGFEMPVGDSETLTVSYSSVLELFRDLRGMGESNALNQRSRRFFTRATLAALEAHYCERYADAEGRLPATFELITLTGWRPR